MNFLVIVPAVQRVFHIEKITFFLISVECSKAASAQRDVLMIKGRKAYVERPSSIGGAVEPSSLNCIGGYAMILPGV